MAQSSSIKERTKTYSDSTMTVTMKPKAFLVGFVGLSDYIAYQAETPEQAAALFTRDRYDNGNEGEYDYTLLRVVRVTEYDVGIDEGLPLGRMSEEWQRVSKTSGAVTDHNLGDMRVVAP